MFQFINLLILIFLIYFILEFTKDKLNQRTQICIILIILLLFINSNKFVENFSLEYLNQLDENENQTKEFCRKLNLIDKKSEDTILLKKFRKKSIDTNKQKIKELRMEIDKLFLDNMNQDIFNKNNYKVWQHEKAKKQVDIINKAKENLLKKNSVQINLN